MRQTPFLSGRDDAGGGSHPDFLRVRGTPAKAVASGIHPEHAAAIRPRENPHTELLADRPRRQSIAVCGTVMGIIAMPGIQPVAFAPVRAAIIGRVRSAGTGRSVSPVRGRILGGAVGPAVAIIPGAIA